MPRCKSAMRRRPRLPQRQRGAALITAVGVIVAMVTMMALAIDLGQVYATKENLSTAANIAAIDASRAVAGCNENGLPNDPDAAALAAAQAAVERAYRNRGDGQVPAVAVAVGAMQSDGNNTRSFTPNAALPAPGQNEQTSSNSAVRVVLSDSGYTSISGAFIRPVLNASASASAIPSATFQVGSSILQVDNPNLPSFIPDILNVDAGIFEQGQIVNAQVALDDFAAQLGLSATSELFNTATSLGSAIQALNQTADGALDTLVNALATSPSLPGGAGAVADQQIVVGDILSSSGNLAVDAEVSTPALADALVQLALAERNEAIELLPNDLPDLSLPGITDISIDFRILQPPTIATGVRPGLPDSFATSSQIALQINVDLDLTVSLGGGLEAAVTGRIPFTVRAGFGRADLVEIDCASAARLHHLVTMDGRAETATIAFGLFTDINAPIPEVESSTNLNIELSVPLLSAITATSLQVQLGAPGIPALDLPLSLGDTTATPILPLFMDPGADDTREIVGGLNLPIVQNEINSALSDISSSIALTTASVNTLTGQLSGILGTLNTLAGGLLGNLLPGEPPPAPADSQNIVDNVLLPAILAPVNEVALAGSLSELLADLGLKLGAAEVTLISTNVRQPVVFESR